MGADVKPCQEHTHVSVHSWHPLIGHLPLQMPGVIAQPVFP